MVDSDLPLTGGGVGEHGGAVDIPHGVETCYIGLQMLIDDDCTSVELYIESF